MEQGNTNQISIKIMKKQSRKVVGREQITLVDFNPPIGHGKYQVNKELEITTPGSYELSIWMKARYTRQGRGISVSGSRLQIFSDEVAVWEKKLVPQSEGQRLEERLTIDFTIQ